MDTIGYKPAARRTGEAKQEAFKRGETREIMGIGISFFTEIVGAGPCKELRHSRCCHVRFSAEIRVHPTGSVICPHGHQESQGQGHETTYAQIIATEIGIPGRRYHDRGRQYRHRTLMVLVPMVPVPPRSRVLQSALAARKIRKAKAQMIAAHMLEVHRI
jgi:carbon-monoxide dehydrogenase large subunit